MNIVNMIILAMYVYLISATPNESISNLPFRWRLFQPLAGAVNVIQPEIAWADNISHGELIRVGYDETLTVDPSYMQFLIQGVSDQKKQAKVWRNSLAVGVINS